MQVMEQTEHPQEQPSLLVNREEACRLLGGIDKVTLWRIVQRGDLSQVQIGRRVFFPRSDLVEYVDRLRRPETQREGAA